MKWQEGILTFEILKLYPNFSKVRARSWPKSSGSLPAQIPAKPAGKKFGLPGRGCLAEAAGSYRAPEPLARMERFAGRSKDDQLFYRLGLFSILAGC